MTAAATTAPSAATPSPSLGAALVLTAMAGGLGWGIRGQYGHETGAMIAGVLVGLTLVLVFCPGAPSLGLARAVALFTVALSFGGSMTYGQTIGLTQNASMIGNWDALGWGLLGLAIKGAIWIGFGGLFLGMGLGGVRYRVRDWLLVLGIGFVLLWLGTQSLNEPFDPEHRVLPRWYFSADWRWEPEAVLRPRRERWGGLLLALLGMIVYAGWWRRDGLAWRLAGWGMLGGGLGFPLGQCLQAYHAWNLDWFRSGAFAAIDPVINWWNMMETTFGAVFGAVLALGLWRNRRRLVHLDDTPEVRLRPGFEWLLLALHVALVGCWNFGSFPWLDPVADLALTMGIVPILAVASGRYWPYLLVLPVVALPIAAKTVEQLCYEEALFPPVAGWLLLFALPLLVTGLVALRLAEDAPTSARGRWFASLALGVTTWLYWSLNFAFFHLPWPWTTWTARTPNAVLFTLAAVGLTVGLWHRRPRTA